MGVDTQIINRHIFAEGNIQLSPQEIMLLNSQPPSLFKASYLSSAVDSGYRVFLTGYANEMFLKEQQWGLGQPLENSLNSLRSNPRPFDGFTKKGAVDTRLLETRNHHIWYKISSGQVLVYNIEPKSSVLMARDKLERAGVYKIQKSAQGVWKQAEMVDSVTTQYAAVNGQSNNLTKAIWLMGAHLEFEFGKGRVQEYTLFHNPSIGGVGDTWESVRDKLGLTTNVTEKFSALLQKTQNEGNETKWVAHSQGGLIFAEAVRYHLNGNSSWALKGGFNGVFRKDKGYSLDKHSVAFHGNANNNLRSRVLFERAGVGVIAVRSNDYDMVNTIIGLNTANPWRIIGSAVYANHVFSGSINQSPHTLMHDGFNAWDKQMKEGPGKGRGAMQKGFNSVDQTARKSIRYVQNFLK